MKKLVFTLAILAGFAVQALAYDFVSGNLLYTILSTDPPRVSLDGHVDGTNAQGELVIPETVEHEGVTYTVTTIAQAAFLNCSGLSGTLVLPNSLIEIQEMAFKDCSGLTGSLDFPETLTQIKYAAFAGCTGFSGDLVIPNSVVEIGCTNNSSYYASGEVYPTFADCFNHLSLSESIDTIGMFCFWNCTQMEGNLFIPNNVKEIQRSAFMNCTGFSGLTLGNSLTGIGTDAFAECVGFSSTLVIPESVTEINTGAFSHTGFEGIMLHPNIHLVGSDFFSRCNNLEVIEIPEGWDVTGKGTFSECSNLTTVHLPSSLVEIQRQCFSHCTNLTDINLPEGLETINQQAFSHCFGLSGELVIPDSVEVVYPYAFDSCYNIQRVVLGSSVNHFAEESFRYIPLEELVVKATTPSLMEHASWQLPRDLPVIVPCGTLEAYQNAEGWHDFTNITENCSGLPVLNGSEWYYEIQNANGSITYQHLEYAADTTVNHKDVQIIIRTNTLYDKGEHTEVTREYLYEENGKVYWWNPTLQEFTVLYDFSSLQGDEWEIKVGAASLTIHVDAVEQYEYEGRIFKMLQVSDVDDLFSGTIVCGIGHLTSFFPERLMTRGKNFRVEGIRCYWREGELVFKYGDMDCDAVYKDYHSGLNDYENDMFAVYPNPTHSVLVVETRRATSLQVETYRITNLMGQILMSGTITTENQQIDVSNLPKGMYFISIGKDSRKFVVDR